MPVCGITLIIFFLLRWFWETVCYTCAHPRS